MVKAKDQVERAKHKIKVFLLLSALYKFLSPNVVYTQHSTDLSEDAIVGIIAAPTTAARAFFAI